MVTVLYSTYSCWSLVSI